MDQKSITSLERVLEDAIGKAIEQEKALSSRPSERTIHLMAKAAVSVYEAVAESFERR